MDDNKASLSSIETGSAGAVAQKRVDAAKAAQIPVEVCPFLDKPPKTMPDHLRNHTKEPLPHIDVKKNRLHLDSTSSDIRDRVQESIEAQRELAAAAKKGFVHLGPDGPLPKGTAQASGSGDTKSVSNATTDTASLAKCQRLLNGDLSVTGWEHAPAVLEYVLIVDALDASYALHVDLPRVIAELGDAIQRLQSLRGEAASQGGDTTELDACIAYLKLERDRQEGTRVAFAA